MGLKLLDIHGSNGIGRSWGSTPEDERLTGVELIRNRIDMTARLSGCAVVLHLPPKPNGPQDFDRYWASLRRSLDELKPHAMAASVRIALENMENDGFEDLERIFSIYDSGFLGLCYDSGHGNIGRCGLDNLEQFRDRLISIYIHDNNGKEDQHDLPFTGIVDWAWLALLIADSPYEGCVSLESNMRGQNIDEQSYLEQARQAGSVLARLIETQKEILLSRGI